MGAGANDPYERSWDRARVHPPPLMLLKGTEQRGECDAKGAGETAYGVVLPRCW